MSEDRQAQIHQKGFDLISQGTKISGPVTLYQQIDTKRMGMANFEKVKLGGRTVTNAIYDDASPILRVNEESLTREGILRALTQNNLKELRSISQYFYKTSGIYARLINYISGLFKYDYYISPIIYKEDGLKKDKTITDFNKAIRVLDEFQTKQQLKNFCFKVLRDGCYYGYILDMDEGLKSIQDLPLDYCRSSWSSLNKYVVEFNLQYFDDKFKTKEEKERILKLFPDEITKAYKQYKAGTLKPINQTDKSWVVLDQYRAVKFNINKQDIPYFINVIPYIIDLDVVADVNKKKVLQKLVKILIQKLPMDNKGEIVFDNEEAQQIHNNAVMMLQNAIGVEVLTTFADVTVEDIAEDSDDQGDDLSNTEKTVYNNAGVSELLFNADNSVSLQLSIKNDESTLFDLIEEFELFLNLLLMDINKKKKTIDYHVRLLKTTIYNYENYYKYFKELSTLGYSRQLPLLALGIPQASVLNDRKFEQFLDIDSDMMPPLSSNTMGGRSEGNNNGQQEVNNKTKITVKKTTQGDVGRPTNESKGEVITEKTAQNKEAQ